MPVLETEGRVASRSEAENALFPVMYRQHALSADRSHIATPINATRTLRRAIFAYRAPAGLITICSMHMQDRGAVANPLHLVTKHNKSTIAHCRSLWEHPGWPP